MRRPTSCSSALSFILVLLFLSESWGQRLNTDNKKPSCDHCNQQLFCNCSHSGFTSVPTVTGSALSLDLSFNKITAVMNDDLTGHMQLKVLDLHGNTKYWLSGCWWRGKLWWWKKMRRIPTANYKKYSFDNILFWKVRLFQPFYLLFL